jgi:hypothetical protein
MELHVITKAKGKTRKATEDFRAMKAPTKLSFELTYVQFLESVAKAAGVRRSQLDHEHMRWKHRKPASSPLTNISEDESYRIMVQAVQSKKVADRWIIVEMGKPFLSEAVSRAHPLLNSSCARELKSPLSHGPREGVPKTMTTARALDERFVLESDLRL